MKSTRLFGAGLEPCRFAGAFGHISDAFGREDCRELGPGAEAVFAAGAGAVVAAEGVGEVATCDFVVPLVAFELVGHRLYNGEIVLEEFRSISRL